jgi:hypothetical protein
MSVHLTLPVSVPPVTVVIHNPDGTGGTASSLLPTAALAGTPVTATPTIVGFPNGSAHGQVSGTNCIYSNPA